MALSAIAFALNLNTNVLGALLPFVREPLGLGEQGGLLLVAVSGGATAVGALCVGGLARRFGRRAVLGWSLAGFVAASLLHLAVLSFWPFFAVRGLASFAVGISYAVASASAADLAPYHRRGAIMGRFNAVMFLAIPVGLPLAAWFAENGFWSWIFAVQAAVGAGAGWLSVRWVPAGSAESLPAARWSLLRNGGVLAGLVATMLHVGSFFTVVQLATTWLDETGLVPKDRQLWVWVGLGALSVFGSAGFARLSDRLGKRLFVLICSAVLVGCFVAMAREPAPAVLLVIACVLAVAAAARTGPLQALLSGLVPDGRLGALMGLRSFCMQLGVFAFALGAAPIDGQLGFRGVLYLAAGCQVLSYLAIRFGIREPGRVATG